MKYEKVQGFLDLVIIWEYQSNMLYKIQSEIIAVHPPFVK
jgi:hypothetical protein